MAYKSDDSRYRSCGQVGEIEQDRHAPRPDGRKALLLHLQPEVTLELKKVALEISKPAYEVAEGDQGMVAA